MTNQSSEYKWLFQRMGGLDQVMLRTTDELTHLDELDPKLWVALSCPVEGLDFDRRTLQLLDDGDGRIRVREVQEAVRWTVSCLAEPVMLTERREDLPLSRIRSDTQEGQRLLASARRILRSRQKPQDASLTQEDVTEALQAAELATFNGDGVMVARPELDPDIQDFITDVVTITGGVRDASGEMGADLPSAEHLMAEIRALVVWKKELDRETALFPLAQGDSEVFDIYKKISGKLDDYFLRCSLAAYEPGSLTALNAPEPILIKLGESRLDADSSLMAELPLAHVEAHAELPLDSGFNPAWRNDLMQLREKILTPLLGHCHTLCQKDWEKIKTSFSSYVEIAERKPQTQVENLGWERLEKLFSGDVMDRFSALVQKDLDSAEEVAAVADVERLVLFHRHLYRLLMNFVSFSDFYTLSRSTTFQIGTLYLDGRSCHLCLAVDDVVQHAELAKLSHLCLVYCECRRNDQPESRKIVAAVTAGNASLLVPGRHGVFVDNNGLEWDATLVKLVENPISIRTSIFSPYRRMARMISHQVAKLTAAKDEKILAQASKSLEKFTKPEPSKPAPLPFDIGKSVGIFAALGLALGAIGTAVAGIAAAILSMAWWQFPLLFFAIFVLVSGPAAFLAWLNLRKRTLGPVLDASNWAVNSQIPINLTMGNYLTGEARLPKNITKTSEDPLYTPNSWKKWLILGSSLCLALLLSIGAYWGWKQYGRAALERLAAPAAVQQMPAEKNADPAPKAQ